MKELAERAELSFKIKKKPTKNYKRKQTTYLRGGCHIQWCCSRHNPFVIIFIIFHIVQIKQWLKVLNVRIGT